MSKAAKHSVQRIRNSAWFVVSVYTGLLLGDLVKSGIYPAVFNDASQAALLPLMGVTLIFLVLSVVESYVWLNPRQNRNVSGAQAFFELLFLLIYILSVLFMAFLTLSLTNQNDDITINIRNWVTSFAFILCFYSVYNSVWIIKGRLAPTEGDPGPAYAVGYTLFYFLFAVMFFGVNFTLSYDNDSSYIYTSVTLFFIYLLLYFLIWWNVWHSKMFHWNISNDSGHIKVPASNADDTAEKADKAG